MLLLQFVPFLTMLALFAAYQKLAARILRRTKVSWFHCAVFALIVGILAIGERALLFYSGLVVPPAIHITTGLAFNIALGGWFFSTRGTTQAGRPLGWRGGIQLSAVALCLLMGTAAFLFALMLVVSPNAQL